MRQFFEKKGFEVRLMVRKNTNSIFSQNLALKPLVVIADRLSNFSRPTCPTGAAA